MPGLPPNSAVTSPIIKAVCNPTIGESPATSEKPTASGIIETATTKPASTSFLTADSLKLFRLNMDYSLLTDKTHSRSTGTGTAWRGKPQEGGNSGWTGQEVHPARFL
ncbi:hypothetical protein D3C87_1921440 [compost metagenome]